MSGPRANSPIPGTFCGCHRKEDLRTLRDQTISNNDNNNFLCTTKQDIKSKNIINHQRKEKEYKGIYSRNKNRNQN